MIFKLAKANLLNKKKNSIINIVIITLCLFLIIIVSNFAYSIKKFCIDIRELPTNRIIMAILHSDETEKDKIKNDIDKKLLSIKNIPNVTKVINGYPPAEFRVFKNDELKQLDVNNWIKSAYCMPYYEFQEIKLVDGRYPTNECEIMIPKYYLPTFALCDKRFFVGDIYYNGSDFLGKTYDLHYTFPSVNVETEVDETEASVDIKAKVVGVYDSASSFDLNNNCYLSASTFEKYMQKDSEINSYFAYALVDKTKNAASVEEEIANQGVDTFYCGYDESFTKFCNLFAAISIFIICVIAFLVFYCLKFGITSSIKNSTSQIATMKSMGYNNSLISRMVLTETFIKLFISIALSYTICIIALVCYSRSLIRNLMNAMYLNMKLNHNFLFLSLFIILLLTCIMSLLVFTFSTRKITKISVEEAIKG